MVFYHTSPNVKMIKNILTDFKATENIAPYEYMETYVEKYPEETDNLKLQWVVETFLGIQKHWNFLKQIASTMSDEFSEEEQGYFMIYFHAVTFELDPKDLNLLYKSLFNLNKHLLDLFTKFLANNESLTFISHIASQLYDTVFITENIIGPLFNWQPYISEMEHSYEEYTSCMEYRKIKPLTVPIPQNVLNRKHYESLPVIPPTVAPPNSIIKQSRKMVTKSTIDNKLKQLRNRHKEQAAKLLKEVKNNNFHFAQGKSDKYFKTVENIQEEYDNSLQPPPKPKKIFNQQADTKPGDTIASLKRLNKRIQLSEDEEIKWLQDVLGSCRNTAKFNELVENERKDREREREVDIERKHLLGQISHEEAVLAKKKLQDENKKKYEDYLKEKELWNEEIEKWKEEELEKHKKIVESYSLQELAVIKAKNGVCSKKKEDATKVKKETEILVCKMLKEKKEDMERKINMIKEIKILSIIARKANAPKIIDLTQTAGLGLLCEMSIAELQERLNVFKMKLKEEVENKKKQIRDEIIDNKKEIENTKETIKNYMTERAEIRKINKERMMNKPNMKEGMPKEICDLKNALLEKRKQRLSLTT